MRSQERISGLHFGSVEVTWSWGLGEEAIESGRPTRAPLGVSIDQIEGESGGWVHIVGCSSASLVGALLLAG